MSANLTASLSKLGQERLETLLEVHTSESPMLDSKAQVHSCLAMSDFVFRTCQRDRVFFEALLQDPCFEHNRLQWEYSSEQWLELNESEALQALRIYRHRAQATLACQHFLAVKAIKDCMHELSCLADWFYDLSRAWAVNSMTPKYGRALSSKGEEVYLVALGMGKLGGYELNFSSDIDLIFCYSENGHTQGGRRQEDFQPYFTKVAQKIIHLLDSTTVNGQVYRVDMRLRPFGDSGPLVASFAALESYYQEQGREWERYALLKARPLASPAQITDIEQRQHIDILQRLKPFVFRRYIDFSVIESLRTMKQQIRAEVRRRKLVDNIKLGEGGIREAEFVVQAMQILRGGKEPQLQQASLLSVLPELGHLNVFNQAEVDSLQNSYLWLRDCEQVLQAIDDKQTQTLPTNELDRERLLIHFRLQDWSDFKAQLAFHTNTVGSIFEKVIGDSIPSEAQQNPYFSFWQSQWQIGPQTQDDKDDANDYPPERAALLETLLFHRPELLRSVVTSKGRDKLDGLLPTLMAECELQRLTSEQLTHVLRVIKRIATRTTYLTLLTEHKKALAQLIELTASCQFIGDQLRNFPMLLDQLIDPKLLYSVPKEQDYFQDLNRSLLRVDPDDLELQMEILRQFKLSSQLIVAACDVKGIIDVPAVSNLLTALAEAILEHVVNIAWRQMVIRYGLPFGATDEDKQFAIIAYGKLGGYELGYGSDLDIVFIHNCDSSEATNGKKEIDSRQFYLKLAQRIMHICTTRTATGILYEVDTRLRPSGASGLLAINIQTYFDYLQNEAWTWEHQALVRSRIVYSNKALRKDFEVGRRQILVQSRDGEKLRDDIASMRVKMIDNLSKETPTLFDLKQSRGGIADIEFITQFLVLCYAHRHPTLSQFSDNKRLLKQFAEIGLITTEESDVLWEAYQTYRDMGHHASLKLQDTLVPFTKIANFGTQVKLIWSRLNLS